MDNKGAKQDTNDENEVILMQFEAFYSIFFSSFGLNLNVTLFMQPKRQKICTHSLAEMFGDDNSEVCN